MRSRPPLMIAGVVFAAAGLLVGLTDARALARFPLERFGSFLKLPRPRGMDWIPDLQQAVRVLDAWERPLAALAVLFLMLAFGLLAPLLSERFALLKPPEENPGKGASAHLDVPRLIRVSLAVCFSFWISGAFAPIAALLPKQLPPIVGVVLAGGIPAWALGLPTATRIYAESLLLFTLLWLVWAPGGPISPRVATAGSGSRLMWGLLAGSAAVPAMGLLYHSRGWLTEAAPAFSLSDPASWRLLFSLAVAGPPLAAAVLALVAYVFRPHPVTPARMVIYCLAAVTVPAVSAFGVHRVNRALASVDAGSSGLAKLLNLPASPLPRFALLLTPRGRAVFSRTMDGTDDGTGNDRIASNVKTIGAVELFLAEREFRTVQAFRAFIHLHDCASIDWLETRTLRLDLEFLERTASPVAAELLLERIADCPITPEHRYVLDQLSDPKRFVWPQPFGDRWLGAAYRQYGDSERALEYLRRAKVSDAEFKSAMGGVAPLADGTIRGNVLIKGVPGSGARMGLVRAAKWRQLAGDCRPFAWRNVVTSTYANSRGAFQFAHIPEGEYVIILTWGELGRDRGRPAVVNPPGVITIDRFRPVRTLKPFDIRFEEPARVRPSDEEPGTTSA